MKVPRRRVVLVAAALLVVTACTGDDDTVSPTTTAPAVTTTVVIDDGAAVDLTVNYVRALADDTVDTADVAVNGSDAARYLELRRTTARILGIDLTARTGASAHRLCDDDGCAAIADFVVDATRGLVETFSVDGEAVGGRISGIGTLADADGIVSRVRVAYRTNAGQVALLLVTTNTTEADVELFGFAAVYRPASGEGGVEAAGSWGEARVAAGASGTMVLVFDTDQLGGRVGLHGLRSDGHDVELDIAVPAA